MKLINELRFILTQSNKELMRTFQNTPLTRARGTGLKRNAIVVAANLKLTELSVDIKTYLTHDKLGELSRWAISQLDEFDS